MKRYRLIQGMALLVSIVRVVAASELRIMTTTPDLAAIARAVSGEAVEVRAIARGYQDPHYVEAKPSYMRRLSRADLLIYNGLELEIGWLPLLVQGSRNRRVLPGSDGSLDASRGLAILEVPAGEVDRSMGDIHPQGNPHYALDPRNGLRIAAAVAARLQKLAPERSAELSRNLAAFQTDLSKRIQDWEGQAGQLRGRKIVAFHKQWEYLAVWLELDIVDYVEVKPGIPPSPRHIADLVERMRREDIALILQANFGNTRPAERVAERVGAKVLRLPAAVDGEEGIESYPDLFETIVQRLVATLEEP